MKIPQKITTPFTAEELIKGFYQNGEGNCVSIGAIKCSLMAFKTKTVFKNIQIQNDKISILMRDEFSVEITSEEYTLAKRLSKFEKVDSQIFQHAILMFSAMAKRAQMENNDGQEDMNYAEAIETLNDGENYKEGFKWLGLLAFVIYGPNRKFPFYKKARRFLKNQSAGIGKSPKHVWFSSNGLNDESGTISKIRSSTSGSLALDIEEISQLEE